MNASTFCIHILEFNFLTTSRVVVVALASVCGSHFYTLDGKNGSKFTLHSVNGHCLRFALLYKSFSSWMLIRGKDTGIRKGCIQHTYATEVFRFYVKSNSKLMRIPLNWFGGFHCESLRGGVFWGQVLTLQANLF